MARYEHDFMGIPADFGQDWGNRPGGLDPNYRDAYRGQPMRTDDPRRAPYGRYRLRHQEDLGGQGGFGGEYGPRGYDRDLRLEASRGYDREHRPTRQHPREYLRDFNAHSPAFEEHPRALERGRGEGAYRRPVDPSRELDRDHDFRGFGARNPRGFAERGIPYRPAP